MSKDQIKYKRQGGVPSQKMLSLHCVHYVHVYHSPSIEPLNLAFLSPTLLTPPKNTKKNNNDPTPKLTLCFSEKKTKRAVYFTHK